jgi:CubicO group peptidase (beta-lactamase class C family)
MADLVDRAVESARAPSLVAATGFAGRSWWTREAGDVGTQYRIGSITKTFTAALVMRLRDEGLLQLEDPVGAHVPDAPFAVHSVRHLLAHSSGMPAEPAGAWWERTPGGSWQELAAANAGRASAFVPGERFHYSNLGFAVLGELVARRRGVSWWDCVRNELLEPLGLAGTTYDPVDGAAVGTSRDPLTGVLVGEPMQDTGAMAPAGQLWSRPEDLLTWIDALVRGNGDVLAANTIVEMRTVASGDPDEQHHGAYGLGLRLHWSSNGTLVGHTGSMPGFLAAMFADPASEAAAVVLTNATTGIDPEKLAVRLLACMQPLAPRTTQHEDESDEGPTELLGAWYWGNTPTALRPTSDGVQLVSEGDTRRFLAVGTDLYRGLTGYTAGEELHVVRRPDGTVSHLEVATFVLTRTPYDPSAPIPGGPPRALD